MIARDRILVNAAPTERRPGAEGVIDVFDALDRQFFWADTVMVAAEAADADEQEVLVGEVVWHDGHT